MLVNASLVGAGGFIGAIFRYGLSGFVQRSATFAAFPYGTLAVNMLGCLLIGIAVGLIDSRQMIHPEFRSFVLVGVLGGFTTNQKFSPSRLGDPQPKYQYLSWNLLNSDTQFSFHPVYSLPLRKYRIHP